MTRMEEGIVWEAPKAKRRTRREMSSKKISARERLAEQEMEKYMRGGAAGYVSNEHLKKVPETLQPLPKRMSRNPD